MDSLSTGNDTDLGIHTSNEEQLKNWDFLKDKKIWLLGMLYPEIKTKDDWLFALKAAVLGGGR
jgi:hypothetical protein